MNEIVRPAAGDTGFPAGASEMARLIREHDWTATPLGPVEGWPEHLRTLASTMLAVPQAM